MRMAGRSADPRGGHETDLREASVALQSWLDETLVGLRDRAVYLQEDMDDLNYD